MKHLDILSCYYDILSEDYVTIVRGDFNIDINNKQYCNGGFNVWGLHIPTIPLAGNTTIQSTTISACQKMLNIVNAYEKKWKLPSKKRTVIQTSKYH